MDGLGVFQLKDRKAHIGRNPRTGEPVVTGQYSGKKVVKLRVEKILKEAILD